MPQVQKPNLIKSGCLVGSAGRSRSSFWTQPLSRCVGGEVVFDGFRVSCVVVFSVLHMSLVRWLLSQQWLVVVLEIFCSLLCLETSPPTLELHIDLYFMIFRGLVSNAFWQVSDLPMFAETNRPLTRSKQSSSDPKAGWWIVLLMAVGQTQQLGYQFWRMADPSMISRFPS